MSVSRSPIVRAVRALLTVVVVLTFSSCASGGTGSGSGDPAQIEFAPELGIFLGQMTRTSDGLYYHDMEVGTGDEARLDKRVTIHYNGWRPDGSLFDSSIAAEEPFVFILGRREVIRGWDLGIRGMRVGGRRLLVIPPGLAYGSRGLSGVIERNATLVFEVELLDVSN